MAAARKDKVERDRQLLAKRRAGFLAAVRKLGLEREFERLPLSLRNTLYVLRPRASAVELAPEVAALPGAEGVRRAVASVLDVPLVDMMGTGQKLSWNEMWWVVLTLVARFGPLARPAPGPEAELARALGLLATDEGFESFGTLELEIGPRLSLTAQLLSRIDERIYGARVRGRNETDPYGDGREVLVYASEPRRRTFVTRGARRQACQVGIGLGELGTKWLEWDREKLGLGPGPRVPVYVQGHAMRRMLERLPGAKAPENRGAVHLLMCKALCEAEVVQRIDEAYWVAFGDFTGNRLGYFLAEVVDGAVLVRTFKFLTMHGSPEARQLYKRFGARRGDFEHLRLDALATFVNTDLERDTELRQIFADCGCGHLFDLRKTWAWPESGADGTAEWVRKYLELGPAKAA